MAFHPDLTAKNEEDDFYPFEQMYELEARHFWFRSRNRLILWALQKYFPKAENFLEIGSGSGFVLNGIEESLPGLKLYGSEVSSRGLSFAAKRSRTATLFQMDAREIPFESEMDVIGAFDVLEHIPEDEEVLAQMHCSTRPGGGIMVTVPMHPSLWSPTDDFYRHIRRYRRQELIDKVLKPGFEVVKSIPFVFLLLPLMVFSRFSMKIRRTQHEPLSEMKVGNWANSFLGKLMGLEGHIIRYGMKMPVGGSMLLIAKKVR